MHCNVQVPTYASLKHSMIYREMKKIAKPTRSFFFIEIFLKKVVLNGCNSFVHFGTNREEVFQKQPLFTISCEFIFCIFFPHVCWLFKLHTLGKKKRMNDH